MTQKCQQITIITTMIITTMTTRKAVVTRRYLRQGKAIRQVASPSSLCQWFPYAPFNLAQW